MIERAYTLGEGLGLSVWTQDEAGPFQAIPQPGSSWQPQGEPERFAHEYVRGGTAKLLTLFHPTTGELRVKGVTSCTNAVLHPWLREQLSEILRGLPAPSGLAGEANQALWRSWQEDLSVKFTLSRELPPLRMLLIWDNLAGHKSAELLCWLMAHGVMVLYTPLAGSWLNMAESIQRIVTRRALSGQHPKDPQQIIDDLEAVAHSWHQHPTPFVWGGKRSARRERARSRRHVVGGSGALTYRPVARLQHNQQERLCA